MEIFACLRTRSRAARRKPDLFPLTRPAADADDQPIQVVPDLALDEDPVSRPKAGASKE